MKNLIIATLFVAFGIFAFWNSFPAFLDGINIIGMYVVKQTTVFLPYLLIAGAVFGVVKLTKRKKHILFK